jgi:hypothetical protein
MSNLANKPPLGLKDQRESKDPARLEAVAAMPCVICKEFGFKQLTPTQVHHCIHGRYGTLRAHDDKTIPLCCGHHVGDFDTTKIAIHRAPAAWKAAYGLDTDWLAWVEKRIEK